MLDFHINQSLVPCSKYCVPLLHWCFNKRSHINFYPQTPPCTSVSSYVGPYCRLYDSEIMRLPIMLTTPYNLSLSFCQLVVDLLCLGFLFCIPVVFMVIILFFRSVCTILQLRYLSNFQIKSRHVIGLKRDTRFPFSISFTRRNSFPVTIHLGKLFSWRHLSNWSAILVGKLFKLLILYPCTPSALGFSSSAFFLPPSLLLKFQYVCHLVLLALLIYSPPSSTNLCFVCVLFICLTTAWSHISLQKHLLSSAFSITLSLCVSSKSHLSSLIFHLFLEMN